MAGLAEVLLRDLQFDRLIGFLQRAEQGRGRFAHLKIDGAVFDLHDHVVVELAVERLEVVVGGAAAVVLRIGPIGVMVVDEAAIEEQAAVRLQGARQQIGGVGVRSAVGGGTDAAFGIGLEHEAGEIGDGGVQRVDAVLPPRGDLGLERVEGVESAEGLGAAEIDGQRDAHAPGAEGIGDAHDLRNEIGGEHARVGVDVVDGARVDAERSQQAAVLADAREILAGLQVVPEDGAAAVAALDGAIQIVPLVDPAHGGVGRLLLVELGDGFAESDLSQEGEGAVEHAAIVGCGDHGVGDAAGGRSGQPVSIQREVGGEMELRQVGERAEEDGGFFGQAGLDAQGAAEHAAHAAE